MEPQSDLEGVEGSHKEAKGIAETTKWSKGGSRHAKGIQRESKAAPKQATVFSKVRQSRPRGTWDYLRPEGSQKVLTYISKS